MERKGNEVIYTQESIISRRFKQQEHQFRRRKNVLIAGIYDLKQKSYFTQKKKLQQQ